MLRPDFSIFALPVVRSSEEQCCVSIYMNPTLVFLVFNGHMRLLIFTLTNDLDTIVKSGRFQLLHIFLQSIHDFENKGTGII